MTDISEILNWIYLVCLIGTGVLALIYVALNLWYDKKLKTVAIDGEVYENVKCEINEHCNEVTLTFPDSGRRVTIVYEEFEILKD